MADSNQNEHSQSEDVKKLAEMIKGIRIAMLTTADEDGSLRSRPMATQDTDFDGTLWFFTADDSPKVDEVQKERHVNLSFGDGGKNRYVSVSGTATLVKDAAKMKELYSPFIKGWFPDGLEDPKLALLKVEVSQAEYWDAPNSTVVRLAGFVKALVTHQPIQGGENEKIDLK